ncbi:jerky protein homolog-like [Plasmopara halstedii]|uniref:Jerky protein homolog-like n=1 Tax=Plasmopara halstedii TaxID=4781 RepID=A0A0P1AME7_PLAHL|nr:jerky protein homolog-like [Plasmopara halstedii]CEG41914.1 jerky protein homolog-like [Plasmopara halstedii]|eukprot:XP_024578283.1 jerky protein homolog-like [Plasmopara halstedii]
MNNLHDLPPSDVTDDALTLGVTELPSVPPCPNATTGLKRKRVVLSIHDKQQVLQRLDDGEQPVAIARIFGISRQQVSDIRKNRDRIVAFCIDAKHMSTLKRKTLKTTSEYHPGVEQELYRWLIRQRKLGRNVSAESLTTKTTDLFAQYSPDDSHVSLKAAKNWLKQFKKAHGIKFLTEEELRQLPEKFAPTMDMIRPGDMVATYSQTSKPEATISTTSADAGHYSDSMHAVISPMNAAVPVSSVPFSINMNSCMHAAAHGKLQVASVPIAPLQATINTVRQLNAQLTKFERDMMIKLDYLDERVLKLCYLVLPTRLAVD